MKKLKAFWTWLSLLPDGEPIMTRQRVKNPTDVLLDMPLHDQVLVLRAMHRSAI